MSFAMLIVLPEALGVEFDALVRLSTARNAEFWNISAPRFVALVDETDLTPRQFEKITWWQVELEQKAEELNRTELLLVSLAIQALVLKTPSRGAARIEEVRKLAVDWLDSDSIEVDKWSVTGPFSYAQFRLRQEKLRASAGKPPPPANKGLAELPSASAKSQGPSRAPSQTGSAPVAGGSNAARTREEVGGEVGPGSGDDEEGGDGEDEEGSGDEEGSESEFEPEKAPTSPLAQAMVQEVAGPSVPASAKGLRPAQLEAVLDESTPIADP
ncbi:hypothetical protein SCHPADRAFT_897567 [Schizopora paradoxa]|uniref:Uncharacterized protein n=1 Tax=Schizopora paradoxa TaxID=27342 RepID=A0A0H2QXS9_9AGAM|nr:hypothetical protein SCHPADRAFT_897567 [Schizopora paradoxa]